MLVQADGVPARHNVLAALCTWLLLAGYIVLPATFDKLEKNRNDISLAVLAAALCITGIIGCLTLLCKYRRNYIWIVNRIFIPALLHSIAGLVSTLINVYTAQDGDYSVTATAALTGTSLCLAVTLSLSLVIYVGKIGRMKRNHDSMEALHNAVAIRRRIE
ncbi:uncharacterized protein EI97DRAFT_457253 [Westerdykella ornata]|uniref:Uncharacterized protein n=1 Tax=Westerdykella ornata TaxID=318751 RepID=A0A6A6JQQ3_WESOR|nr:uncharacterized protein EI97DRAFT_457253 [Westerdykella ornata]KAF2278026.1 hypothetical protein EI97DRAFT_457253 [Westerdykella ornata]